MVANEIAVTPPGVEHEAKTVDSDLDQGIDKNLDAALVQNGIHDGVKYDVKNGVVTLKGQVNSQIKREQLTKIASSVPYVQQVVNELQVKEQKATSSNCPVKTVCGSTQFRPAAGIIKLTKSDVPTLFAPSPRFRAVKTWAFWSVSPALLLQQNRRFWRPDRGSPRYRRA